MSYTKEQEAILTAASPLTYDNAVILAKEINQPLQSIISKMQFMGLEYIKKEVPTPKPAQETKAEILVRITKRFNGADFGGLIGSTRDALVALDEHTEEALPNS